MDYKIVVKLSKGWKIKLSIAGILTILFFGGCLIAMLMFPNETVTPFVRAVFALFVVLGGCSIIYAFKWRIIVQDGTIKCCGMFRTKRYAAEDITIYRQEVSSMGWSAPVQLTEIDGYIHKKKKDKKIFEIFSNYPGYSDFMDWVAEHFS